MNINPKDLSNFMIGDSGVSVQQLIDAYQSVLDGEGDHDIHERAGLPYDEVTELCDIRWATHKYWSELNPG